MPVFEREISVKEFMSGCSVEEIKQVLSWVKEKKSEGIIVVLPSDGSHSDEELNGFLTKISDARMQLTNEDLDDLKRIACKYR